MYVQVRIIDSCLKLHGALCPPEFVPFHETLEKFFRKNFNDEIRRLGLDAYSDALTLSASLRSNPQGSTYEQSIQRSMSTVSTQRPPIVIPPLQLGRNMTSPLQSPHSGNMEIPAPAKQTTLQRHLAHLARHGLNGVSSAPGDTGSSDSPSTESPRNSFVNVIGNGVQGVPATQASGASVTTTSNFGSLGSLGSLKGRFSRFGSLNFGRRGASGS